MIITHDNFAIPLISCVENIFDELKLDHRFYNDTKNNCSGNCVKGEVFDTVNLLNIDFDKKNYLFKIINQYTYLIGLSIRTYLDYKYVHFVEYIDGEMLPHNHAHAEDYCSIIYLNNSSGYTYFYKNFEDKMPETIIHAEKGKIVQFPSNYIHSSPKSKRKKTLVLGYTYQ